MSNTIFCNLHTLHNYSPLCHIHTFYSDSDSFPYSSELLATRRRENSVHGVDIVPASWEIECRLDTVLELDEEGELCES